MITARHGRLSPIPLLVAASALAAGSGKAPESVLVENVPHIRQKPDFCGEACVAMYMRKLGYGTTQDDVFNAAGVDPVHARGCVTREMATVLKAFGFDPGPVWHRVEARSRQDLRAQWRALHRHLAAGVPSIVCMRTGDGPHDGEHFRLVLGYDAGTDEVIYHEPAARAGAHHRMELERFLDCWPLKYGRDKWTVIRMILQAKRVRPPRRRNGLTDADFAQHIMALKDRLPGKGFTVLVQRPFVVVGDEPPPVVRRRAEQTVEWAVTRLKSMYFRKAPDEIIDIWLFKDEASYRKHAWEVFRDRPDTPFGYSSREHKALVMNIATGGGTLVHEIVHPFMEANFPECPAWFNEGLASLYEQSRGHGRRIVGLTNWRLAGLQEAIAEKRVPSFKALTGTTDDEFYNEDPGTNYAQARYLCYYLQQRGLLERFYGEFAANHRRDSSGYGTLKRVLGERDMDAFQRKWEEFVTGLRFP